MAKRGPRPIELDWEEVGKLAQFQCTQEEVAWFYEVSVDTLERACKRQLNLKLADFLTQKRLIGRSKLRVKQMQVALSGNVPMLIFLGKQYLGQSDKVEQNQKTEFTVSDLEKFKFLEPKE